MDPAERDKIINEALQNVPKKEANRLKEKLHELLFERKIPFLPSTNETEFLRQVRYGSFGIIELIRYQKKLYAHKRPLQNSSAYRNSILEEAIKLTDIGEQHENIQRLYFINLKSIGFLMDYCCYGSLDNIVEDNDFKYTLVDALNWSYQLADALSFLHSKKIMHRDVKLSNTLLKDNYHTTVLTDYGTAAQVGSSLASNIGSPITMAPEVYSSKDYGEQCDIYSWSIVFWQLLSKTNSPYEDPNTDICTRVLIDKLRPSKLNHCPELFLALMYRSWHSDPKERPTLSFIKKVLRLILNLLPKSEHDYLEDMIHEVKKQWINDSDLSPKYLPNEPRSNNEKSRNIYQDHLREMKHILEIRKSISDLEQKLSEHSKPNEANRDPYENLLMENTKLQQEIDALRAMKLD